EVMQDFTRVLRNDNLPLSLMHLNDATMPIVFEPPTLYSFRARSKDATQFYVQGTAKKALTFDTSTFTIEQGAEVVTSTPVNIKDFEKGRVSLAQNDKVDGVLIFSRLIDVKQPFTIKHDKDSVKVEFTKDQLSEMTPPPAK